MLKTPLRFFLILAIILSSVGLLLDFSRVKYFDYNHITIGTQANYPAENKLLIEHYLAIGQIDNAIKEYQNVLSKIPPDPSNDFSEDLNRLLKYKSTLQGQLANTFLLISWAWPVRLYLTASVFFLLWVLLFFVKIFRPPPLFVILPFDDFSGLDIGEKIPELAFDRIKEAIFRTKILKETNDFLAENMELPALGFISEGDVLDAAYLLETALSLSTGLSDIPFARILKSIQLWLQQPQYLVKGRLEKNNKQVSVHLFLSQRGSKTVDETWHIQIDGNNKSTYTSVLDVVIYPLLYNFGNKLQAKNWKALQHLQIGLQEFQLFRENNFDQVNLKNAEVSLLNALTTDPNYVIAQYNLGLVYLTACEYEKAREHLREIYLNTQQEPLRTMAMYNYGVAMFSISQDWAYKYAINTFEKILAENSQTDPELEQLVKATLAMVYAKVAVRLQKERIQHANASLHQVEQLLKTTEDAETKSFALTAKGYANLALKEYTQSRDAFQQSIALNPDYIQNYLGLGDVYQRTDQLENALSAYRKATFISPYSAYAKYKLGHIYQQLRKIENAIDILKKAPNFAQARLLLGKIYQEENLFTQALDEFRAATSISSHLSEAWVNIAWTILELGDREILTEAEQAARRSLQLDAKNISQLWHRHAVLARCLLASEKYEKAYKEALAAFNADSEKVQSCLYLAQAEYHLKYYAKARESLKKVRDLDKKGIWLAETTQLQHALESVLDE
jgi:tetratricopeptide (TPR) repeat protein